MSTQTAPTQIRWRTNVTRGQPASSTLMDFAHARGWWGCERWPILYEVLQGAHDSAHLIEAHKLDAFVVGTSGVIVLRTAKPNESAEQSTDEGDDLACRVQNMLSDIPGTYRRRQWRVPIRVLTDGGREKLSDNAATLTRVECAGIERWARTWSDAETIDEELVNALWKGILPRTTRGRKAEIDARARHTLLTHALNGTASAGSSTDLRNGASALRAVIRAVQSNGRAPDTLRLDEKHGNETRQRIRKFARAMSWVHVGLELDEARESRQ